MAGSVPDLQLDVLVVEHQGPDLEVHADGREVVLVEAFGVIGKPAQETRLANAALANRGDLEDVVRRVLGIPFGVLFRHAVRVREDVCPDEACRASARLAVVRKSFQSFAARKQTAYILA